jgi:hypothetical protein
MAFCFILFCTLLAGWLAGWMVGGLFLHWAGDGWDGMGAYMEQQD